MLTRQALRVAIPKDIVERVARWCEGKAPRTFAIGCGSSPMSPATITILERSLMPGDDRWLRVPSAQLRFIRSLESGALYWVDSHDRWHLNLTTPSLDITELLAEMEVDRDCLFFG